MNRNKALDATAAFLDNTARFFRLSRDDYLKLIRDRSPELFALLSAHPDFAGSLCGLEAHGKLKELCAIAMSGNEAARNSLHPDTLLKAIEWQICDRFMKKGQSVTKQSVDRMLGRAVAHALSKQRDAFVAIPCCVVYETTPEPFQIASIQFIPTPSFLARIESDGLTNDVWMTSPHIQSYIDSNPWVALAHVRGLDPKKLFKNLP